MKREAKLKRKTSETDIEIELKLDKPEIPNINTGIGFFDHMLTSFAFHGEFGLKVKCKGDLNVDGHHTVEDVGIVLGRCFNEALGDKAGIARFGEKIIPMDEALGLCAVDVSGRAFLVFEGEFKNQKVGDFELCLFEEFLRAFAVNAGITLHVKVVYGKNDHHKIEACFKAMARAMKEAVIIISECEGAAPTLSTKGVL
ncbi:MAG: imidazoleglycerol-phosphate dehydratase HisB [Eubacterium sp.]|jgi:imidazoleglycerol-phosphate dehydratase|nr:imidazoleglycerol-phosphate dehydratase HisB [Eubacterium sp.]